MQFCCYIVGDGMHYSGARLVARAIDSRDISTLTNAKADQHIRNPRVLGCDIKTVTELLGQLKSQAQNTGGREGIQRYLKRLLAFQKNY